MQTLASSRVKQVLIISTLAAGLMLSAGNLALAQTTPSSYIYTHVVNVTRDAKVSHAADTRAAAVTARPGDTLRYEVSVHNKGKTPLTNIRVTDDIPAGVTPVKSTTPRHFTLDAGSVQPGKFGHFTITVKVTSKTNGQFIDNKACFKADHQQSGCNHAVVKVSVPAAAAPAKTQPAATAKPAVKAAPTPQNDDHGVVQAAATATVVETNDVTANVNETDQAVATEVSETDHEVTEAATDHNAESVVAGVTEMPKTGAEQAAGGAFGLGALGLSLRHYLRSRRSLTSALLRR